MNQQQDYTEAYNQIGNVSLYDYQDILVSAPIGIFISTPDGKYLSVNPAYAMMLGYDSPKNVIDTITDIQNQLYTVPSERDRFKELLKEHGKVTNFETQVYRKDGSKIWINFNAKINYDVDGNIAHYVGFMADITTRKYAEESLLESEEKFRLAFDGSPDSININRLSDGFYVDVNQGFCRLTGYLKEEVIGKSSLDINIWHDPNDRKKLVYSLNEKGFCDNLEAEFRLKDGQVKTALMSAVVIMLSGVPHIISITRDISDLKRIEKERENLQAQLNQAQKMESVGRLAGGVAHDFNNMLTIITGFTEMALSEKDLSESLHNKLQHIQKAAGRSTKITQQLLAFARKQTIAPKLLDLNITVGKMISMLQRLIGEDINLTWKPANSHWSVMMDPSQVDQILINLCVNARDAIAGVGMITIETGMQTLDEAYCAVHNGFIPGKYVTLTVSDDGCGMNKEILSHLFEPFFTTKNIGEGTGLGLATIYGIVKQNDGFITCYSEPGYGSTFKVYLPRHKESQKDTSTELAVKIVPGQGETILLVEDEPDILDMAQLMLESFGYSVLIANTPGKALDIAAKHSGIISLLITDVIMPEMNGRDLSNQLMALYPNLKCLFMSGYTQDVIDHRGILDEGVNFIQKPFSMKNLASKVRSSMDS